MILKCDAPEAAESSVSVVPSSLSTPGYLLLLALQMPMAGDQLGKQTVQMRGGAIGLGFIEVPS